MDRPGINLAALKRTLFLVGLDRAGDGLREAGMAFMVATTKVGNSGAKNIRRGVALVESTVVENAVAENPMMKGRKRLVR